MKTIHSGLLFIMAFLFCTGCVKEDLDDCPDDAIQHLVLHFEYLDPKGSPLDKEGYELFATRLQTVDVLIYDAEENLYQWIGCDDVIYSQDRRKVVAVEPGEYFIIGWANNLSHRTDFSTVFPESMLTNSYIYHDGEQTADPLHYAPDRRVTATRSENDHTDSYKVTVERNRTTEHTLSFMSAHRTLNVYLRGFPEVENDEENPVISVSNLTSYYDNYLGRGAETTLFTVQSVTENVFNSAAGDRELLGFATYYLPHFDNENNIILDITRPALPVAHESIRLRMEDILEKLELEVEDGDDLVINVLIELSEDGTFVRVKIPEWLVHGVDWK